jgi:hypothetical protein
LSNNSTGYDVVACTDPEECGACRKPIACSEEAPGGNTYEARFSALGHALKVIGCCSKLAEVAGKELQALGPD